MNDPVYFESAARFRAWLAAHAHAATELLVGFRKVGSGLPSMRWSECQARSLWSAVKIDKVAALRAEGLMTPAGGAALALRSEAWSLVYSHERPALADCGRSGCILSRECGRMGIFRSLPAWISAAHAAPYCQCEEAGDARRATGEADRSLRRGTQARPRLGAA